jgi:hypothetical protein
VEIFPSKKLNQRFNFVRLVQFIKDGGREPVKEFI